VHKMRFPGRKRVLMALAGRYLPREIIVRRKSGFGVPLREWFQNRHGLGQHLTQISSSPLLTEFFGSTSLGAIIDQQVSGKADHSDFLWAAVNFVLWRQQFGA